jgi:hypothetical protein
MFPIVTLICSSVSVTTPCDDDDYDVANFTTVIDNVPGRLGKYLLVYTHFKGEQIPHALHYLNEVQHFGVAVVFGLT